MSGPLKETRQQDQAEQAGIGRNSEASGVGGRSAVNIGMRDGHQTTTPRTIPSSMDTPPLERGNTLFFDDPSPELASGEAVVLAPVSGRSAF